MVARTDALLETLPTSLRLAAPVMKASALSAALKLFSAQPTAFRVHLDDTCGMPSNWSEHWRTWDTRFPRTPRGAKVRASTSKYIADSFLFHMLAVSPFAVSDWRDANASVVVLVQREYGGAGLAAERCRRKLAKMSPAWRATGGARHFFILTTDRGPCCNNGALMQTDFLRHHVIGHHGELRGHHWRLSKAPDISCFHDHKDISIPTPRSVRPPPTDAEEAAPARTLLAYYAGGGLFKDTRIMGNPAPQPGLREGRRLLHKHWGNLSRHPGIVVVSSAPKAAYDAGLRRAKFCPVMGGYAPWSPRLGEAIFAGCVPVLFSSWLPPFSRVLDWQLFSLRVGSLHDIADLPRLLAAADHAKLQKGSQAARHALWYRLEGGYAGDDMLPFLILEMHLALSTAAVTPLATIAEEILNASSLAPRMPAPRTDPNPNRQNHSFYYEGQTIVSSRHYGHERHWECFLQTRGTHPVHVSDPEATYEVGNSTRSFSISPSCVCRTLAAVTHEVISPTQRDLGSEMCTEPCQSALHAPNHAEDAWCGKGTSGVAGTCNVVAGETGQSWKKKQRLVFRSHTFVW